MEGQCPVQWPKPKKRKRGKNGPQPQLSANPYARYAVEIQIQFFLKVSSVYLVVRLLARSNKTRSDWSLFSEHKMMGPL